MEKQTWESLKITNPINIDMAFDNYYRSPEKILDGKKLPKWTMEELQHLQGDGNTYFRKSPDYEAQFLLDLGKYSQLFPAYYTKERLRAMFEFQLEQYLESEIKNWASNGIQLPFLHGYLEFIKKKPPGRPKAEIKPLTAYLIIGLPIYISNTWCSSS